jgi:hypothetical protein
MWTCSNCNRIFEKVGQPHSCKSIPIDQHFKNKEVARKIFDELVKKIDAKVGKSQIISLPCCIHLFGKYDYLAALPKSDKLEIRFGSDHKLENLRVKQSFQTNAKFYKICIDIKDISDIDEELIGWISLAYHLKEK